MMAEPTTAWDREAVQGSAELKRGMADANRRLEAVEGKLDGLRADFAEFRGTVRGIGSTICVLLAVFGALGIAGAWVATTVVEHEVELAGRGDAREDR